MKCYFERLKESVLFPVYIVGTVAFVIVGKIIMCLPGASYLIEKVLTGGEDGLYRG